MAKKPAASTESDTKVIAQGADSKSAVDAMRESAEQPRGNAMFSILKVVTDPGPVPVATRGRKAGEGRAANPVVEAMCELDIGQALDVRLADKEKKTLSAIRAAAAAAQKKSNKYMIVRISPSEMVARIYARPISEFVPRGPRKPK